MILNIPELPPEMIAEMNRRIFRIPPCYGYPPPPTRWQRLKRGVVCYFYKIRTRLGELVAGRSFGDE